MKIFTSGANGIMTLFMIYGLSTGAFAMVPVKGVTQSLNDTAKQFRKEQEAADRSFKQIYLQNTLPATAGWEFFEPVKTLLVADLHLNFVLFESSRSRFFFLFDPHINVRLFTDAGSPVKSPSFMPGGTLNYRLNADTTHPRYISLSYSHHSNGVRGPTLNAKGDFNVGEGKFTTNFYTLSYHYGREKETSGMVINRYTSVGLELHSALLGLGYSEELKGKYGFVRLNGRYLYTFRPKTPNSHSGILAYKRQTLEFTTAYIMDQYDHYEIADFKKRLNTSLKYYYQLPFMRNAALMFGGGYRGQDEYNIYFQDSYAYLTFGLASGLSF